MRGRVTRVLVLAVVSLAAGGASPAAAQEEPVELVVRVVDRAGHPVGDAAVSLVGLDAVGVPGTDDEYRLVAPPGPYSLRVAADGFQTRTLPVELPEEDEVLVELNRPPTAAIGFSQVPGRVQTFRAVVEGPEDEDVVSVEWSFDGQPSTEADVEHDFVTPGPKTVTLTATDDLGAVSEVAEVTFTIANRRPTVTLGHSPAAPRAGDTVTLTATGADADGDELSYAWDLDGDEDFDDGSGASIARVFPAAGRYRVAVRVRDGYDETGASAEVTVTAVAPPPPPAAPRPSAPPAPRSPAPPPAAAADIDPPELIVRRLGSRSLRSVRRRGLRFAVACDEPCTVYLEVVIGRRAARRVQLGHRARRLARDTVASGPGGSRARLRLGRKVRKRLAGTRRVRLTLQGSAWDAGGYATLYAPRRLTLRRG